MKRTEVLLLVVCTLGLMLATAFTVRADVTPHATASITSPTYFENIEADQFGHATIAETSTHTVSITEGGGQSYSVTWKMYDTVDGSVLADEDLNSGTAQTDGTGMWSRTSNLATSFTTGVGRHTLKAYCELRITNVVPMKAAIYLPPGWIFEVVYN